MRNLIRLIVLLALLIIPGCQANKGASEAPLEIPSTVGQLPSSTPVPASPAPLAVTPVQDQTLVTKMPESIIPTGSTPPITGEVPPNLLEEIRKDLAARAGVDPQEISVVQAQAVVWNDGSLGCPQPGMEYTQVLVNGYQVILAIGDQKYDYHAANSGHFFLCEGRLRPISPPGTPNS